MYCMSVASTIAKWPFSISTVTLWYGEDDIRDLYSCISMSSSQSWLRGIGKENKGGGCELQGYKQRMRP